MYLLAIRASYVIDDIRLSAREVIGNPIDSFGSRYFLSVVNERTSFASCASVLKSSRLVISLRVTEMLSEFSSCDVSSADCRSIIWGRW